MVRFEGVKEDSGMTLNFLVGALFILGFIFTVIPPLREALGVYLFLSVIAFVVYRSVRYQGDLIGISKNNLGESVFVGILAGLGFYFLSKLIPGFSFGVPMLPAAISDSMKFFVIVFVAPWIETIAIQGALFGYLLYLFKNEEGKYDKGFWLALFGQALFFALLHLGAYIYGFYQLPSFMQALTGFYANLASFLTAFLFAIVAGLIVYYDGIKNLLAVGIMHMIINFSIYIKLAIVHLPLTLIKFFTSLF